MCNGTNAGNRDSDLFASIISVKTKEDVIREIELTRCSINEDYEKAYLNRLRTKSKHSKYYFITLLNLIDQFRKKIEDTILFDAPGDMWCYSLEIHSTGISLFLTHYEEETQEFEGEFIPIPIPNQDFELITVPTRLLTVDEYAELYRVEEVTVRQWIRRGKIRDAIKLGGEWRIPELSEMPSGEGYQFREYETAKVLHNIPVEYSFLQPNQRVMLCQDEEDKSLFWISLNHQKYKSMKTKEREKFELFLISHPDVKYKSTYIATPF